MGGARVCGRTIRHVRGDTGTVQLSLYMGGEPYDMQDGDSALLTVKKKIDGETLLQVALDDGVFAIEPEATEGMRPGHYWYDIQVTLHDGEVVTVAMGRYVLLPDVTTEVVLSN